MMLRLIYEDDGQRKIYDLIPGSHLVGRSGTCDIQLQDASVSGQHLRLDVRDDGSVVEFRDLQSSNGTFLGTSRIRVEHGVLRVGVALRLGRFRMEVENEDATGMPVMVLDTSPATAPLDISQLPSDGRTPSAPMLPVALGEGGAPRALLTVPANQEALPPYAAGGGRKKRLLRVVAGLLVAGVVVVLALPSNPPRQGNGTQEAPVFEYFKHIREGEDWFRRQNYLKAYETWKVLDDDAQRRKYTVSRAAEGLARVARAYYEVSEGRDAEDDWNTLAMRLREIQENDTQEIANFARELRGRVSREPVNRRSYENAVSHMQQGAFDAAENELAKINESSIYGLRAKEIRKEIESQRGVKLRADAETRARDGQYTEAVRLGKRYLLMSGGTDAEMTKAVAEWESRVKWETLENEFLAAEAEGDLAVIANALERLYPNFPPHYIEDRNLEPVRTRMLQRRTALEIATLFDAWDVQRLSERLEKENDNLDPQLIQIRSRFAAIRRALGDFEAAERVQDFDRMQAVVDRVRELDGIPENHMVRQWAKSRARSKQQLVQDWLSSAETAWQRGQAAETRRRLRRAQQLMGVGDLGAVQRKLLSLESELSRAQRDLRIQEEARSPSERLKEKAQNRIDELMPSVEELRGQTTGRDREQFLRIRKLTIDEAKRLSSGRNDPMAELVRARDATLFHAEDEEARALQERIRARYKREFDREIPKPVIEDE